MENLEWERKIEVEKLREVEAKIDLASRGAALADVHLEAKKLKLDLAGKTLDALRASYKEHVDRQVAALKKASATEGACAASSTDPLERYRAQRNKEILDQKALLEERDNELKTTPAVSLEEEEEKVKRAREHLKELKKAVSHGRSADIVAQRLNNNYRRLASERASLVRNELATVTGQMDQFDRELTEIESIELNDLQGDRAFRENLLSLLAPKRRSGAIAMFEVFEKKKHEILQSRKRVLAQLSERAELTQKKICERIAVMDEAHAFIRTHLFWVRDQPPLGLTALDQGRRDARDAAKTLIGMAGEVWARPHWLPASPEFLLAAAGLVVLPWFLHRIRKVLRQRLGRPGPVRVELAT